MHDTAITERRQQRIYLKTIDARKNIARNMYFILLILYSVTCAEDLVNDHFWQTEVFIYNTEDISYAMTYVLF